MKNSIILKFSLTLLIISITTFLAFTYKTCLIVLITTIILSLIVVVIALFLSSKLIDNIADSLNEWINE